LALILRHTGLKDWRVKHSMRDPVRGELKVTGRYFAHPGSDAQRRAAVTAPGIVLPVRIDPADPARAPIDVRAFDAQHPGGATSTPTAG
jgi:hypothetical protein